MFWQVGHIIFLTLCQGARIPHWGVLEAFPESHWASDPLSLQKHFEITSGFTWSDFQTFLCA